MSECNYTTNTLISLSMDDFTRDLVIVSNLFSFSFSFSFLFHFSRKLILHLLQFFSFTEYME